MICQKDNFRTSDSCSVMDIAVMTVLGNREDQQDCFGYSLGSDNGMVVLCDGMGGHKGGAMASKAAVTRFVENYASRSAAEPEISFLNRTACEANEAVRALTDPQGRPLHAGSTAVSLIINKNALYWCSIGDSRAYLFRDGEFVQFTLDHNYKTVLEERKRAGVINDEEFRNELKNGEALISFLGIDELKLIDYNDEPLYLKKDDKIIIMSDGLYKLVPDNEIATLLDNFSNISDALQALDLKAAKHASSQKISRDNMTVFLIKIKNTEE